MIGLEFRDFVYGGRYRGDVAVEACAEGGEVGVVGLKDVQGEVGV